LELNQQIHQLSQALPYFMPELFTLLVFVAMVVVAVVAKTKNLNTTQHSAWQWGISLGAIIFLIYLHSTLVLVKAPSGLYHNQLVIDGPSYYIKLLVYLAAVLALLHIRYFRYILSEHFYMLFILQIFGLQLLTVSNHFLIIYLAVEIVSVVSYVMVAMGANKTAREASLKYALFGGVASALMLYGFSLYYGITGTFIIDLQHVSRYLHQIDSSAGVLVFLLIVSGFLFKLSAFPFHIWAPDVFETAPTPVASWLSAAPKAAVALVLLRVSQIFPENYQTVLIIIAMASMALGNFAALNQQNAKRMMGYSGIAQMGFIIAAIACGNIGTQAVFYYLLIYILANMAVFLLIDQGGKADEAAYNIENYSGKGQQQVLWAVLLLVAMVTLVGLPPTAGFSAKLLVFSALWQQFQNSENILYLVALVFAVVNTVISLYFYLKLPYFTLFKGSAKVFTKPKNIVLVIAIMLVLALFYFFVAAGAVINALSFAL
jgi:NADH-quinone oxidoreductase subunit N